MRHGHTRLARQQGGVAELHGAAHPPGLRPLVQHGLPMHADQVDVGPRQRVGGQEFLRRGEVFLCARRGGLGEDGRLRRPARPRQRLSGRLQHDVAGGFAELAFPRRAEGGDRLAVGLQHRHVDGVERGSGHESEDAHAP
jgi:hypothetical protein